MRSVSDVHGTSHSLLPWPLDARGGDRRRVGLVVVKETTLEVGQMNRVSMPSEVVLDAGVDAARRLGRPGSVNEPREVVVPCGACSGVDDIAGRLCTHPLRRGGRRSFSGLGQRAEGRVGVETAG